MPKYQAKLRQYRKEWEVQDWAKGWLQKFTDQTKSSKINEAYCKVCQSTLRAHIMDLKKHANSQTHKKNMEKSCMKNKLVQFGVLNVTKQKKIVDLKLAIHIAVHSSILTSDHLCETLREVGQGTSFTDLSLHRTKCSKLITKVIAPDFLNTLIAAVGSQKYSLIVDESTDVTIHKFMCLCIRYFNETENKIITDYLGIVEVFETTADALYNAIVQFLNKINLNVENLVAVGTDGASNMCGKNNSLFTKLKQLVPNLQLMRCSCHSLHLAASKATEELPSSLDFLCREVYGWFSCSSLRQAQYKRIFDTINVNEDKYFYKLDKLSTTRWLSRYGAMKKILDQWLELQTLFRIASRNEKCYTARLLSNMFEDDSNKAYFIFLKPILYEINELNIHFQSNSMDVGSVYDLLLEKFLALARRILKPIFLNNCVGDKLQHILKSLDNPLAMLNHESIDYGFEFNTFLENSKLSIEDKNVIMERSKHFLVRLLKELCLRFPDNIEIFSKFKFLHPKTVLSQIPPSFSSLPIKNIINENELFVVENQWRGIQSFDWQNQNVPTNILDFWPMMYSLERVNGTKPFKELAQCILTLLIIPLSNAVVERVFSIMNATKTKFRNKMQIELLDALLRIKVHLSAHNLCCNKYVIPESMLSRFSADIYLSKLEETEEAIIELDI